MLRGVTKEVLKESEGEHFVEREVIEVDGVGVELRE